jgi:hypothetical protein
MKQDINAEDSQGRSLPYFAMRGDQQDMIEYLLAMVARFDSTHTDRQGCFAVHWLHLEVPQKP